MHEAKEKRLLARKERLQTIRYLLCRAWYYVVFVRDDSKPEYDLVAFVPLVVVIFLSAIIGAEIYSTPH